MSNDQTNTTDYDHARQLIEDGDIALMRNGGFLARLSGKWTHAAVCKWIRKPGGGKSTLMLAEVREFKGGRLVTLRSQARAYSGRIDIFRPRCSAELSNLAAELITRQAGHPYGWWSAIKAAALRLTCPRLLGWYVPDTSDTTIADWYATQHCGQATVSAFRRAARLRKSDFDLLPFVGEIYAEPTRIASGNCRLLFPGLVVQPKG